MKVFVGTTASNQHIHEIGRALQEAGMLSRFVVPFADLPLPWPASWGRRAVGRLSPKVDGAMKRRRPPAIPVGKLSQLPSWEMLRLAVAKLGLPDTWTDTIWSHQEMSFDRACSRIVARDRPDVYLGAEHGALFTLQTARTRGICAGVMFTSVHHLFRERWLASELEHFPQLLTPAAREIRKRDHIRELRRDEELRCADFIHANSAVTARSLEEAGVPAGKILTVPLGAPPARPESELPAGPPAAASVLFVGNVAVHKGAHHLLEAWSSLGKTSEARLELYGRQRLPSNLLASAADNIVFHGHAAPDVVRAAMQRASVLVLPSLCDGFGMVVTEAMAQGVPVICSSNVGASQLVREGANGFVVPPADPPRLAERLAWCLGHPAELHAMGRAAHATARQWTWADFRAAFAVKLNEMAGRIQTGRK